MKRWRWWHGILLYGGVQIVALAARAITGPEDVSFYKRQRLPVFAPPPAAFPIAWSVNSICAMAGLLHALNTPKNTPGRTTYVGAQSAAWVLFSLFNAAYFGLRSPINAAIVTSLYTVATAIALSTAVRQMRDPRAAWALASTAAWLALANPLAIAQAAWNRDEFWNAGPFADPPPYLVREPS